MSARAKLHASILSNLEDRHVWEQRQVQLYDMRHRGLRRKYKPFPTASDLHWPLIDTNIEKLKPLYFQQIIGADTVSSFISRRTQDPSYATIAERWFDYQLKECSNFQDVALSWIDFGLMAGRSVLKPSWDFKKKQLKFEAIPTLYSLAPNYAKTFDDMDWWIHVMPMSVDAYERDGRYNTSQEVIDQIKGGGGGDSKSLQEVEERNRKLREGITYSSKDDQVIVWEVYRRVQDKIVVLTYSPAAPELDLRPQKYLPFDHGQLPGIDFAYETTDGGWYSPRGVADILAPFEVSLCNTWNHKHDAMAFFNRPMFKAEREMPNTGNLRLNPGGVLPYGLAPVPMQQSSVDFDEEMTMTRSVAEQRVANPDYGMGQVINTRDRRTAAEINAVQAQGQQSGDLRARCFRISLSKVYRMAYSLLIQYNRDALAYRFNEETGAAPKDALHKDYDIEPKGGLNETNRQMKMVAATNRLQLLRGSAFWNQAELEKNVVELDEPSLIKRAFQDPNAKKQSEAADEMTIVPSLVLGLPVPIQPGQDYMTRIGILMGFLQNALQTHMPLPPTASQAITNRIQAMLGALEQQNVNGARQLRKSVEDFLHHSGFAPQPGAPGMPPPPPGAAPQGAPQPAAPAAPPVPTVNLSVSAKIEQLNDAERAQVMKQHGVMEPPPPPGQGLAVPTPPAPVKVKAETHQHDLAGKLVRTTTIER